MTDFSFLVCHNKCVSMLKRFHTKTNVLRKIFAGCGVYKADDVFRRAYCYLFLTCTGGTDVIKYFERNYRHLLLCTVMMIKDVDKAQDILHNVAVTLLTKQDELRDLRHPGAYVTQCIYRATLNYLRKESRSAAPDPVILSEICRHPDSGVAYDYVEWVISIEAHLQKYSPEMRRVFIEHYLDGVPIETIARKLDLTPNAVSLRLKRMRDALAKNAPDMLRHIDVLTLL